MRFQSPFGTMSSLPLPHLRWPFMLMLPLLLTACPSVTCVDQDGDGYYAGCTGGLVLGSMEPEECDSDAERNPGMAEVCDAVDNDCDGDDEEDLVTSRYFQDLDNDEYGNSSVIVIACLEPDGYAERSGDCDDGNAAVNPGKDEVCNELDDDCDEQTDEESGDGWYPDEDKDGFGNRNVDAIRSCAAIENHVKDHTDCNDADRNINPTMPELCDNIDNNCNDELDEQIDDDSDGFTQCDDCDDEDAEINPDGTETCNGKDDDCDEQLSEDFDESDADEDGYFECALEQGDCDDEAYAVHPNALELCNDLDDNCDGQLDEGYDQDYDLVTTCEGDCRDNDDTISPYTSEMCDSKDNDCDNSIDEGVTQVFYADSDGDDYGNGSVPTIACEAPSGYVSNSSDCDDSKNYIYPGATELCNGRDDNCDGVRDEGLTVNFWVDNDSDDFGIPICKLLQDDSIAKRRGDCDDSDGDKYPGSADQDKDCCGKDNFQCVWVSTGPPVATPIADAVNRITNSNGGTVWVGPGTHTNSAKQVIGKANITIISTDGFSDTYLVPTSSVRALDPAAKGLIIEGFTVMRTDVLQGNGGLINVTSGEITIRDCILTDGKVAKDGSSGGSGGAIFASGGTVTLNGVILRNNLAQLAGGAIWVGSSAKLNIAGGWIHGNIAGPYTDSGSDGSGGGIHCIGNAELSNVRISNNTAYLGGGGFNLQGCTAKLTNIVLSANFSGKQNGGAMRIAESGSATLSHVAVVGNGASKSAGCNTSTGGIWIEGTSSRLTVTNSIISQNYIDSTVSCGEGSCSVTSKGSTTDGKNIVGSTCNTNSKTPAANITLSYSDFYQVGASGSDLVSYGISGSDWTTSNLNANSNSWQKVDPHFVGMVTQDFHLIKNPTASISPLVNAGTPGACSSPPCDDPDGTAPDLGPYGGPGGALWDLDLDGYYDWWWYDSYSSKPSGVTGAWDSNDLDASITPASSP